MTLEERKAIEQLNLALRMALEALKLNNREWKALADSGDSGQWSAEDQYHYQQTEEAIISAEDALQRNASEHLRTWVGLTTDELNMIGDSMRTWNSHSLTDVYIAIEAKLKEKNK